MPDANSKAIVPPDVLPAGETASKAEQFLEQNFKKIVLAIGLVALVLAGIAVSRYFSHQTELEAAQRFTAAKTPEDCDVIVQKYAGTAAAGNALLLKAELLWEAGKKESSVAALQDFIKSQPDHPLLPHALLGLGSKQADLGDKDNARKTLEGVVRDHAKSEAAAAAQTQLGDMLWAEGKIEEAKKLFTELPRNHPGSPFIEQVEERTKMMSAGLPTKEVDPPPAPPKPAETPAAPGAPLSPVPATPMLNVPTLTAPSIPPVTPPVTTPPVAVPPPSAPAKPDASQSSPAKPTPDTPAKAAPAKDSPAKAAPAKS